jgi:hypothetical protein
MSRPDKPVSERVLGAVEGYLTALLTRGAPPRVPPFGSQRELAKECATALTLGLRTVQRAFRHDRIAVLVAQLVAQVAHGGTPRVSPAANPQVTALPPHPDDAAPTTLLLGALRHCFSPQPGENPSRYYSRLEPNRHAAYCVVRDCGCWVEPGEGSFLLPYPRGSTVRVLCAEHALLAEVDIVLSNVKTGDHL